MSSECILSFYFLLLLMRSNLSSAATDTISHGQFITGNQTMVSKGAKFELGFFTPGNSLNYYIGIWYKNIPQQTIIWVGNRRVPVSNPSSSQLKLTKDGNLVLFSNLKTPVWSTNSTSSSSSSVATLLDTGNLVLRDSTNTSVILWQSFDHLTDTWMPGGPIRMNKISGEYQSLISWKNSENPSPGNFDYSIDPDGTDQFVLLYNKSEIYWSTGVWNGHTFASVPEMSQGSLYTYEFVDDDQCKSFTCNISDSNVIFRNVMSPSGQLQTWMWFNSTGGWVFVWAKPASQCDIYSMCGAFGVCDLSRASVCSCPSGFEQVNFRSWELGEWSSGCTRHTQLQCGANSTSSDRKDEFFAMSNMRLPTYYESLTVSRIEECEAACLNNCSCTAYSYYAGSIILNGDIRNLERVPNGGNGVGTLLTACSS